MKIFMIVLLAIVLSGCVELTHIVKDENSNVLNETHYKGARKVAITVVGNDLSIIAGEVAISNETVQVLAKEAAPILKPDGE